MTKKLQQATHQGELDIKGTGLKIPCAVLGDGTRVLRERSVARAIGRKGGGAYWQRKKAQNGALLPEYVSAKNLEPFIDSETRKNLLNPITYRTISGKAGFCYRSFCLSLYQLNHQPDQPADPRER